MAARVGGVVIIFSYYKKKQQNTSGRKLLASFEYNLPQITLRWPSTKIAKIILISQNNGSQGPSFLPKTYIA